VESQATPADMVNIQQGFQCCRSGACCTTGWHVPVDARTRDVLVEGVRTGRLSVTGTDRASAQALFDTHDPPAGSVGVLALCPGLECVCFEPDHGRTCAIHRQIGHDALPSTCQQFPRVALLDGRGVHVTLSHFCPTVAAMLLRRDVDDVDVVRLQDDPAGRRRYEGFDARDTLPPFLRPAVAFDLPSYAEWERRVVRHLGRFDGDPDAALAVIACAADNLRHWTPTRGPLLDHTHRVLDGLRVDGRAKGLRDDHEVVTRLFDAVAASVPPGLVRPSCPAGFAEIDRRLVAPVWRKLAGSVGRYLAVKTFGAPAAYMAEGLRTQVTSIVAARAVLRVEAARLANAAGRLLDERLLVNAACAADALVEHLSDRPTLIRRWSHLETVAREIWLRGLGVEERG
jgi:hypothetical protein